MLLFVHSHFSNMHLWHEKYYHKLLLTSLGLKNFEGVGKEEAVKGGGGVGDLFNE